MLHLYSNLTTIYIYVYVYRERKICNMVTWNKKDLLISILKLQSYMDMDLPDSGIVVILFFRFSQSFLPSYSFQWHIKILNFHIKSTMIMAVKIGFLEFAYKALSGQKKYINFQILIIWIIIQLVPNATCYIYIYKTIPA